MEDKQKSRIALVAPNLQSGGSERMLSRLSTTLLKDYSVDVILFDGRTIDYPYSGRLIDLKCAYHPNIFLNFWRKCLRVLKYYFTLRKNNYKAIFLFTSSANLLMGLVPTKAKVFYSCRGYAYLAKKHDEYHGLLSKNRYILANSQALQKAYLEKHPEDKAQVKVAYNFFDADAIQARAEESLSDEEKAFYQSHKVLTAVSRFHIDKGQWNLLKAFEQVKKDVPDAGLVFVGSNGEMEMQIREMAERSPHGEDILFVGHTKNPYKYMKCAQTFVLPSIAEGFPNVLVEAMLCGTPVIATDCKTGPREILMKEYCGKQSIQEMTIADYGILVPNMPGTPDLDYRNIEKTHIIMAEAIKRMLTDDCLQAGFRAVAKKRGLQFTQEQLMPEYIRLIEEA